MTPEAVSILSREAIDQLLEDDELVCPYCESPARRFATEQRALLKQTVARGHWQEAQTPDSTLTVSVTCNAMPCFRLIWQDYRE